MATLRIGTYNVMAPVPEPLRFYGQSQRMQEIGNAIKIFKLDAISVQESMTAHNHTLLQQGLAQAGFRYSTRGMHPESAHGKLVSGGVYWFLREPILAEDRMLFRGPCHGADCLAAKGVQWAMTTIKGVCVHLFSTHMQSGEGVQETQTRCNQMQQAYMFIQHKVSAHNTTIPVILAGDFNEDRYAHFATWRQWSRLYGLQLLPRKGVLEFSYDPSSNGLVGVDSSTHMKSQGFPRGCREKYLRTGYAPCQPSEWLDQILNIESLGPQADTNLSFTQIHKVYRNREGSPHTPVEIGITRPWKDLSDHYLVTANLTYPNLQFSPISNLSRALWEADYSSQRHRSSGLYFFGMFFVLFVCTIILIRVVLHKT